MSPAARRSIGVTAGVAVVFTVALILLENLAAASIVARQPRLTTNFSSLDLERQIRRASENGDVLVLGDSVLWGYRIEAGRTAVADLERDGVPCLDLAFKGSSPPNYLALLRLALRDGYHPRAILVEIDDKVFNPADDGYAKLNPSVAIAAAPLMSRGDVATLGLAPDPDGPAVRASRFAGDLWLPYGLRSDLKDTIFGDGVVTPIQALTPDLFEGTFDLTPLDSQNVGYRYLEAFADLARSARLPVVAFLTPTNHRLLHDYIDVDAYRSNLRSLTRLLRARGAVVLDLDHAMTPEEFIDESHLTPAGNRHLAALLRPALDSVIRAATRTAVGGRSGA